MKKCCNLIWNKKFIFFSTDVLKSLKDGEKQPRFLCWITKGLIFYENFQSSEDKLLPDREVDRALATKPDTSFSVIENSLGNYPISTALALLSSALDISDSAVG